MSNRVKELESKLERTEQQLRLVQKISRLLARDVGVQEVLRGVVSLVVDFMQCDSCLIYFLDRDRLVLCAANERGEETVGKVSLKLDEGLTGWVARERRLLAISREAYNDPRFKFFKDLPEDAFEAFLSVPVIVRNRVMGVMNVQHRNPHTHTGIELETITTVGEQLGCLLMLAHLSAGDTDMSHHADLVLAGQ